MMRSITPKEHKQHQKELIEFCKDEDNHCLMYNYMLTIENIRKSERENFPRIDKKFNSMCYNDKCKIKPWAYLRENKCLSAVCKDRIIKPKKRIK